MRGSEYRIRNVIREQQKWALHQRKTSWTDETFRQQHWRRTWTIYADVLSVMKPFCLRCESLLLGICRWSSRITGHRTVVSKRHISPFFYMDLSTLTFLPISQIKCLLRWNHKVPTSFLNSKIIRMHTFKWAFCFKVVACKKWSRYLCNFSYIMCTAEYHPQYWCYAKIKNWRYSLELLHLEDA